MAFRNPSLLVAFIVIATGSPQFAYAQWGFEEPDPLLYIDVRAEIGIMSAENTVSTNFAMLRPTFFGVHGEVGHYFDNLGVFSGLGVSVLPLRQKQSRALGPLPTESITSAGSFISLQVPVGISYKLGRAFSVHGAFNMNFMTPNSITDNVSSSIPENVSVERITTERAPSWQFVPEATFGLDYDIGTRMRFLFFGGVSLRDVQGPLVEYRVSEVGEGTESFLTENQYKWWKFGVGLSFHVVR